MNMDEAWAAVERAETKPLEELFAAEPDRLARLTIDEAGLHFDFAKSHLSTAHLDAFAALADAADLTGRRDALFAGDIVNPTEDRAAEHTAERGEGAPGSVARARRLHARMRTLI